MTAQVIAQLEMELGSQPIVVQPQPAPKQVQMREYVSQGPIPFVQWEERFGKIGSNYTLAELKSYGIRIDGYSRTTALVLRDEDSKQEEIVRKLRQKSMEDNASVRDRIYALVRDSPANISKLSKAVGVSYQTAAYHLEVLAEKGLAGSHEKGNSRWYYSTEGGTISKDLASKASTFSGSTEKIGIKIADNPGLTKTEIGKMLDISRNTVTWHLKKLMDAGFAETKQENGCTRIYPTRTFIEFLTDINHSQ